MKIKFIPNPPEPIDPLLADTLYWYEQLTDEQKAEILAFMDELLEEQKRTGRAE